MTPQSLRDFLLALGDDSLILGQRLGEWCGHAPALEIDLSLANFGLDLIGQAQLLLGYAGEVEGEGRDADRLAFHRDGWDFRNCLLVEQPNGDFAHTIARQFLFSAWQKLLFEGLTRSKDEMLAGIAAKAVKEVTYHVRYAGDWVIRLGAGTEESHRRMEEGLAWMWRFTGELFRNDDWAEPIAAGIAVDVAALRPRWDETVDKVLAEAGLSRPPETRGDSGGRRGRHTEHLGHMLTAMQFLPRAYPDAKW